MTNPYRPRPNGADPASTTRVVAIADLAGPGVDQVSEWLEDIEAELALLYTLVRAQRGDPALARGLFVLRASVNTALHTLHPHLVDELGRQTEVEMAALTDLLDQYQFSRPAGGNTVHIVNPEPTSTRERNLCPAPVGLVTGHRPDGTLCGACTTAFVRRLFPTPKPQPEPESQS